ncbi:ABC transporter permease [Devosia sp. 63-57]|uniref:ABC transporter permease n=1 Tax=Devosia sp. 63-57 TaxID=1895751 RepID=UPI000868C1B4|nr:ABC transporter permease [Devosia sp. 63-57]ODT48058.1 MAG: peptide ABC transporter permease [Pelagibacterium sp. SCN 63-126]ODU85707.1 MAG: peptide ABC transporter permease [Pelagibacterium sp. SCN 63-17]OJX42234.1 MAG: peptide ABC transporter permease [Devosia sp. 63-57]
MHLTGYFLQRLARGLVTFWFAVTVTFFLVRLLPGDPVLAVAGPGMTEEIRQTQLELYGLDRPLAVQYFAYLRELIHGNLGISFLRSQPVSQILMERLPWTLLLTGSALLVTVLLGVPLGVLAATQARGWVDRVVQVTGVVGQSLFVPSLGILLLYTLGLMLGWFPIGGAVKSGLTGFSYYLSVLHHLVLPCFTLVLAQLASYVLTLRATLIEALGEEYCDLARAKGTRENKVIWKHALRNALLPTTTLIGLQIGFLVGGAVLTETIYAYPGVGRAIYEAVGQLDFPVLQGAFVLLAATVVIANLLTDIAYGLLDPRVRT